MYQAISIPLAYRAFQAAALPHIGNICYEGGGDPSFRDLRSDLCVYLGDYRGGECWQRKGQRALYQFGPMRVAEREIVSGSPVPQGELESIIAFAGDASNDTSEPATRTVSFQYGETNRLESTNSQTHGWGLETWVEAQGGGGESTGGSYVQVGVKASAHGDYAKAMLEGNDVSVSVGDQFETIVPAHTERSFEQTIQKGKIVVDIERSNGARPVVVVYRMEGAQTPERVPAERAREEQGLEQVGWVQGQEAVASGVHGRPVRDPHRAVRGVRSGDELVGEERPDSWGLRVAQAQGKPHRCRQDQGDVRSLHSFESPPVGGLSQMLAIFAMIVVGLLFVVLGSVAIPVAVAQPAVPHGIAEWAAGFELWILAGVAVMFIAVYGWLLKTVIAQGQDLVALNAWKEATEQRLASGNENMDELKIELGTANHRLLDIGRDVAYMRGVEEGRANGIAAHSLGQDRGE